MFDHMRQRRGTTLQWETVNPILGDGEMGIDKDTGIIKVGNGVTAWLDLPVALSSQYLPILGKAADADKLDGNDSTFYMPASAASSFLPTAGKAADAEKLDGNDSTFYMPASAASSFLPTAGKAADADKLDGNDSTFYMPASAASSFLPVAGKAADADKLDGNDSTYFATAVALATANAAMPGYRREQISRTTSINDSLQTSDEGCLVSFNGTGTLAFNIATNAVRPFPIGGWVDVETINALVGIQGNAGVTIRTPVLGYGLTCLDTYTPVRLLKIGTDEWMPIAGTTDTAVVVSAAAAPWSGNVSWRVKNGWCAFYYIGTSSAATPSPSTIFTFPKGARPLMTNSFVSIYADIAAEVNVQTASDATAPGRLSLNKARGSGFGVSVSGAFPVGTL